MATVADSADKNSPPATADGFSLSRWSRLKRAGGDGAAGETSPIPAQAKQAPPESVATTPGIASPDVAETPLPSLSSISLTEDFTPFMQARVPQALRQQALKALFREPHFNVMDGLDTYIDDYTQFEPISPEVMATLSSWKTMMNPPQQVVTPGGYAVDVESDEGKAVLAAHDEAQANAATMSDDAGAAVSDTPQAIPVEPVAARTPVHPRYGKRVGDFVAPPLVDDDASKSILDVDCPITAIDIPLIPKKDA